MERLEKNLTSQEPCPTDKNGLTEEQYLKQYDASIYDKPGVAVDNLLFAIDEMPNDNIRKLPEKRLQVLLVKRTEHPFLGAWGLPGTFLRIDETFEDASMRCLKLKSNINDMHLEQLYSFGGVRRDPRYRIISVSYMGLINKNQCDCGAISKNAAWFTIKDDKAQGCSTLAFDHAKIIEYGLQRIRNKIEYTDIAFSLLPKQFTLAELQQVYEVILNKKFSKANFQRKIKGKVECLNEHQKGGFRPALLYACAKNPNRVRTSL